MEMQIFNESNFGSVRVTEIDGCAWFYASDIARSLDYSDTQAMTRRLDEEDVNTCTDESSGQIRNVSIISESGFYMAVIGSKKPEAKKFRRWVTSEVLPEIRKTGSYHSVPTYPEALRLLADKIEVIQAKDLQIELQKPAVEFVSKFVESKQTQPLRAVAKVLGVKEKKFIAWLLDGKILYRLNGKLTPKQIHLDEGRFEMKEFVSKANGYANFKMSFTTKGIQWIAAMVSSAVEAGEL